VRIAGVGRAFPPNYYDQQTLLEALQARWEGRLANMSRLDSLHRNLLVEGRHLALPMEEYAGLNSWGAANDAWIRVAQDLGAEAILRALDAAGLETGDVDLLIFVSVTGIATPSIDARLVNRLNLPSRIKRIPIFGLGCVAGAAGVARAADYLRGFPEQVAVLLSVELCSLTLRADDASVANLIASGLFGDGAAAVVVTGGQRPAAGPEIVATRSVFYPDTEHVMGWDISEKGFRIVLSADVPKMARRFLRRDVDAFLAEHGLTRAEVGAWVCHTGGPKVLEAIEEALELPGDALALSWKSLRSIGNLSSASVLMVLGDTLEQPSPPGAWGMMLSMGPGFCTELVLLRW